MAKRIIWSKRAINDRAKILLYWIERTQSKTYSRKLNTLFSENASLISQHPHIGKLTDTENVRVKIIGHYLMFYAVTQTVIIIVTVWDNRRNPDKLNLNK